MTKIKKILTTILPIIPISLLATASKVYAQGSGGGCYEWSEPPDFVETISCMLPNIFQAIQWIGIAAAFVIAIWLIFQMITKQDNPEVIKGMFMKWVYLVIFIAVVATNGGVIFVPLKLIGLGSSSTWIEVFSNALDSLGDSYGELVPTGIAPNP